MHAETTASYHDFFSLQLGVFSLVRCLWNLTFILQIPLAYTSCTALTSISRNLKGFTSFMPIHHRPTHKPRIPRSRPNHILTLRRPLRQLQRPYLRTPWLLSTRNFLLFLSRWRAVFRWTKERKCQHGYKGVRERVFDGLSWSGWFWTG